MVVAPGLRLKQLCQACGGDWESTEVAGLTGAETGGRDGVARWVAGWRGGPGLSSLMGEHLLKQKSQAQPEPEPC